MNRAEFLEGMVNFFDPGYVREVFIRSLRKRMKMGPKEFISQLIHARGFSLLTPPGYETLVQASLDSLTIDLREKRQFEEDHIPGALSHPFDDFLGEVLTDEGFRDHLELPMILVCDTGHMSRVAAGILNEVGFKNLYSIDRGMRRMKRWYRVKQALADAQKSRCPFCHALVNTFGPG